MQVQRQKTETGGGQEVVKRNCIVSTRDRVAVSCRELEVICEYC